MSLINEQDSASRLAVAIATDVRLYNETRLLSGEDVSGEIAEGRQLYRDRVEPSLYHQFEVAIAEVLPELAQGASSTASVTTDISAGEQPIAGVPDGALRNEPQPTKRSSRGVPGALLGVLVVAAVVLAWLLTR